MIIFFATLLLNWSAFAQNIDKNEINEHGVRIIRASQSVVIEDHLYIGVGLEYHKSPQDIENYYITLFIPKGGKDRYVANGQEVKFKTIDDESVIGLAAIDCPCIYTGEEWAFYVMYVVTPETAEMLSKEVSKIRINYTTPEKVSFFDIDTSDGIMARYFKRAYANIKKTMSKPADKDRSEW